MADPNTRQGKRTPVTLKIKFKSETLEQFIERYAVDVSQGGIFIRTKEPLAVGTQMKFEFQLRDASPLIAGEGTVVWTRENDPSRPAIAPGMGVRFDRLADGSQTVLERILAEKAKQAPSRSGVDGGKPLFTDTPTKVAPAPVQEALGVRQRARSDSEQTPLPKPMPFHSDADEFDEKAFEEATKVRSLDELAAQTAGAEAESKEAETAVMPKDELAARRGSRPDAPIAESPIPEALQSAQAAVGQQAEPDRDSAPGLPSPPEAERRAVDESPARTSAPALPFTGAAAAQDKIEPAKAAARASAARVAPAEAPRAVANEPSRPVAPKRPSSAPIVIGILVALAGALAAVWWFVLRDEVANKTQPVTKTNDTLGSAITPEPGSAVAVTPGSAADVGSGSAAVQVDTPAGPPVDTVIASTGAKDATVEVVGTDQKGPAPFTAKLEKDKPYKVKVSAPGFQVTELDIKGGQDKTTAKLVAKPRVISVASEPPGADIYVDNVSTKKQTPADIELTATQSAKPKVRIGLRKAGFRGVDQVLDAKAYTDGETNMTAKVEAKLTVAPRPTGGGTGGSATPAGGGTGSGSAAPAGGDTTTPPAGGGAGSAVTPPPSGGSSGGGAGSAAPAGGGGGGGGGGGAPAPGASASDDSAKPAEPEPTWTK